MESIAPKTDTQLDGVDLFSMEVLGESGDALTVDSPADANRLLGAIRGLEKEIERLEDERDRIIRETETFYNHKIEARADRVEFLQGKVEAFVRSTGQSISVPNGRSYTRSRQSWKWDAVDEDVLREYAEKHCPEAIKRSVRVNKSTLKAYLKDTGDEIVPVREVTSVITTTNDPDND